jgi:hypothetical protein
MEGAVVSDFDIRCAARAMVRRHGELAATEAQSQARACERAGDAEGHAVWRRVAAEVEALLGDAAGTSRAA